MTEPLVLRSDADGVSTLTLNRPAKLNALTPSVFVELRGHLDAIAADESVRCVVLTGAGRAFCAGHDLDAIASHEPAPSPDFEPETVDALERLPQPTIARIHGHCYTGGLELALACDLLVADESARLGDTHGQWGLVPIWGMSVRLPERVGRAHPRRGAAPRTLAPARLTTRPRGTHASRRPLTPPHPHPTQRATAPSPVRNPHRSRRSSQAGWRGHSVARRSRRSRFTTLP